MKVFIFTLLSLLSFMVAAGLDEARRGGPRRRLHVSPDGMEIDFQNAPQSAEWPHLVGIHAEEAKQIILNDRPDASVQIIPQGSMVTQDYRLDRVRIYVDKKSNKVVRVPKIG